MANDDYSKPNPFGKPPKNETLAQKHERVSKFYTYQRKSDQQAAARGDQTAMDQLMAIGRKKGGTQGAQLQREGAERKMGISQPQARNQDYANRPGGDNARMAQGQAMAMGGEGAAAGMGSLAEKLGPLLARMRGGTGMAGQAARPAQQALPRPGIPAQAMQRPAMPAPRPQLPPGQMPMGARPMGGRPMPQQGQVPQMARPMSGQVPRALPPAPQQRLALPAPKPAVKAPVRKSLSASPKASGLKTKAQDGKGDYRVANRKSAGGNSIRTKSGYQTEVSKVSKKPSTASKSVKGSQRSGESTKSTAGNGKTTPRVSKTIGGKTPPKKKVRK